LPIHFTGHSLGGAIAQVESARTGHPADTFNAPGVRSTVERLYPDKVDQAPQIRNHFREADAVSDVGAHVGTRVPYQQVAAPRHWSDTRGLNNPFLADVEQHGMTAIRRDLEQQLMETPE
jgi:hypothetical protein